jgi:Holliday junction resolvase
MSTPEKIIKTKISKELKARGDDVYYFCPATGGYGRSGVPDFICCVRGVFLAIEAKAGGNKTTPLQDVELDKIRVAGGEPLILDEDTVDLLGPILDRLIQEKKK